MEHRETQIYRDIALYLKLQYPKVLYHFDSTGLNLSKTQAGILKSIQCGKGYPDLFIIEPSKDGRYHGLFIEIKVEGTKLIKKDGAFINDHITEQNEFMSKLGDRHFKCYFGVGFDDCKQLIDLYLRG